MTGPRPDRMSRDLDAFLREIGQFESETAFLRDPAFLRVVEEKAERLALDGIPTPETPETAPPTLDIRQHPGWGRRRSLRYLAGGLAAGVAVAAAIKLGWPAPGPRDQPDRAVVTPGGDAGEADPGSAEHVILAAVISPVGDAPKLDGAAWGDGQAFEFDFRVRTTQAAGLLFRIDAEKPTLLGRFERADGVIRGNTQSRLGAARGKESNELFVLILTSGADGLQAVEGLSGCLTADDLFEMQQADDPDRARVVARRIDAALKRAAVPWSGSPANVLLLKTVPHAHP